MKAYFDAGVLVKAYAVEPGTAEALALIRQVKPPIPFTHLHGIEIRNALRLKCGRGEITETEMRASLSLLHHDIEEVGLKDQSANWLHCFNGRNHCRASTPFRR